MLWIVLFLFKLDLLVLAHNCQHRVPGRQDVVFGVPSEPGHVLRKRSLSQHMRINITYDHTLNSLSFDKKQLIRNHVLPKAVDFWQRTLRVRSSRKSITLLRQCNSSYVTYKRNEAHHYCVSACRDVTKCGESVVPPNHLMGCRLCSEDGGCRTEGADGPGVADTDFILYVSTKTTPRCGLGTTVAYAAYCQLEETLDRPVAGYVNICPESISTETYDLRQIVATIKHEILHALGFSAGLFAFFRDGQGLPLTPRQTSTNKPEYNETLELYQWSDKVVKTVTRMDWRVKSGFVQKDSHFLVTPKVVKEVRQHFNCSSLEGAELEDQGIVGTALTHWEKRVFEHEAMTGTYTQNPVISRVTLALMEDTGWYGANYDMADELDWGKNLGCTFVKKSCMEWIDLKIAKSESIHPFCDRPRSNKGLRTECSTDLRAVALCNLIEYKAPMPIKYQYMTKIRGVKDEDLDRYGGSVELADYCPYIQEFAWKEDGKVVRNSDCKSVLQSGVKTSNYALEEYGNKSICMVHEAPWILRQCDSYHELDHWGSGCYRHRCDRTDGLLVFVGGREFKCVNKGQVLEIRIASSRFLHQGSLICPSCDEVCKNCPQVFEDAFASSMRTDEQLVIPCRASSPVPLLSLLLLTIAGTLAH